MSRTQERLKTKKLLQDRDGKPISADKALSRQLAVADSVYQYLKYYAPQNGQQFSDFVLSDEVTVPVTREVTEVSEERTQDGRTIRTPVTRTVSGTQTTRIADDITRRKQEDKEFPLYGYEIYGTGSPQRQGAPGAEGIDPRLVTPPGFPGGPGGPGDPSGPGGPGGMPGMPGPPMPGR